MLRCKSPEVAHHDDLAPQQARRDQAYCGHAALVLDLSKLTPSGRSTRFALVPVGRHLRGSSASATSGEEVGPKQWQI